VRTLAVIKGEVLGQADYQFAHRGIALQIHVLMLDAAPEPLDEDVVERAPPSIHADGDTLAFQHAGEGFAGKLRALIAVEDFRLAVAVQGLLQAIDAESRLHAVADPPAEHPARVPVDDRHQVGETMRQPDVGYVRTPDLIGSDHRNTAQQIGINLVLGVRAAGVWPRCHAGQPHLPHQALYPFTIDGVARPLEKYHHFAAAIEWVPGVFLVDHATVQQIALIGWPGILPCIDRGAGYPGQKALP